MNEQEVDARRQHVMEELLRAQGLAADGDVQGARPVVDEINEELLAAVAKDAGDPDLWGRTVELWWSVGVLLDELQVLATSACFWRVVINGLTAHCPADYVNLLNAHGNLANTLSKLVDLAGARGHEEAVLSARGRPLPSDHTDLLGARANHAVRLSELRDFQGARRLQEAVLSARERLLPPDHADLHSAKVNLAATLYELGDFQGARRLEGAVLAALERLVPAENPNLLKARGNLAVTLSALGELAGARVHEEAVLKSFERLLPPDHPDLLTARENHAATLWKLGDLQGARGHQEAVLAARERLLPSDHPDLLCARGNLANTLREVGDLTGARRLEEAVLAARERLLPPDHPDRLSAQANLAATLSQLGDLQGARRLKEAVLAARERLLTPDHPDLLKARGNLATTLYELGDLAGARSHQEAVLAARERLLSPNHPDLLITRGNHAAMLSLLGDLAGARKHLETVLAAFEQLLPPDHPLLLRTRENLAMTLSQLGNDNGVIVHRDALCEGSMLVTLRAQARSPREAGALLQVEADRLSQLRFLAPTPDFAPRLFRGIETLRAVAVPSARRRHFFQDHPDLEGLQRELREAGATLNRLSAGFTGESGLEAWQEQFRQVTRRRDDLETTLSREMDAAGVRVAAITHDAVAARLGNSVLISYFRYTHWELDEERKIVGKGPSLLAHVLRGDGTLHQVELGTIESLLGAINTWRSALEPPRKKRNERLTKEELAHMAREPEFAESARELLFDPIVEVLGGWEALALFERIIVVPDDIVHLVPFDALVVPNEFRFERLFDVLPVQIEVSLRRFVEEVLPLEAGQGLLSVGGVHYDGEGAAEREVPLPYLPGTLAEMSAVSRVFESCRKAAVSLLSEARASVEAVKSAVRSKRVVHFATHGWFGLIPSDAFGSRQMPSPVLGAGHQELALAFSPLSLCGLAFAGAGDAEASGDETRGRATGEELATWELGACELAILSACQTNVGAFTPGQGIQSLQTAVHAAGARTALTSLWSVPDDATAMLTNSFCTLAFDSASGLSVLEAARRAKQKLRDTGAHASGWAGWVLTGDPGPLVPPGE